MSVGTPLCGVPTVFLFLLQLHHVHAVQHVDGHGVAGALPVPLAEKFQQQGVIPPGVLLQPAIGFFNKIRFMLTLLPIYGIFTLKEPYLQRLYRKETAP